MDTFMVLVYDNNPAVDPSLGRVWGHCYDTDYLHGSTWIRKPEVRGQKAIGCNEVTVVSD